MMSNFKPHSFAIAGKWRAAFVDPPVAATTTAAFFKASIVTISLGLIFFFNNSITCLPLSIAYLSRSSYGAGVPDEYGNAKPIASDTHAIVFAVNCPPQAPADGQATSSSSSSSLSDIFPASCIPTPSKTSKTVTSLPLNFPGSIDPPYIKTLGTFNLHIAIIRPGKDLSQPAKPTNAS